MIEYKSYVGGPIFHTEQARYNSALAWYRTISNLGFPKSDFLVRLARFIRYGVLNADEASAVFYGRIPDKWKRKYLLMVYYIDDGWESENAFYFVPVESLLWQNVAPVVNIIQFP